MKVTHFAIEGCLSNDIVLEILLRLPTRSLLRFSCVAKSWNSLIFSKHFSKKHLQCLQNFEYRIMLSADYGRKLEHFSLRSAISKFNVPVFDSNHVDICPTGTPSFYAMSHDGEQPPVYNLIGSCNGLICIAVECISGNDIVYLWNPSIQKSKNIPSFGDEPGYDSICSYGFGFDESCDDYKVVAFYFSCTDEYDILVKIFSLKTGEVKRVMNHTGRWLVYQEDQTGGKDTTFTNGKIHWLVQEKPGPGQGNCYIAYLDLATEEYGKIEKPDSVTFSLGHDSMMALPGGSLYVYCYYSSYNSNFELIAWLVKPSYVFGETTWTEFIVSIPIYCMMHFGHRNPLFILADGVTLWLRHGSLILIFNPNDFSVRPTQLTTPHHSLTGISYIESLVSPV